MSRRKRSSYKKKAFRGIGLLFAVLILFFAERFGLIPNPVGYDKEWSQLEENGVVIHYLDVGQAHSALLVSGDEAMMIDAGNRDDKEYIDEYLNQAGITELKYLVLTHPHEDHIGSAPMLIREYQVETLMIPKISIDQCETAIYADTLAAADEKDCLIDYPKLGESYELGNCVFTILYPGEQTPIDVDNLNENSIGLMVQYGDNHFLFYGDGEINCETSMLESGYDLAADVLLVAHHGSSTSSDKKILRKINPEYAIISCEKDNTYGFPHKETMEKLNNIGAKILRTDEIGTIVVASDGKEVQILTSE